MRLTLLKIVQQTLGSLGSDEVNSISDTIESLQIVDLVEQCYYDLCVELNLPEHELIFQLDPSGDNDKPCLMTIPSRVTKLYNVRYDKKDATDTLPKHEIIQYIPFADFLVRQTGIADESATNVDSMTITQNGESFSIVYRNDKDPDFYTTIDDFTLLFDSYDNTKDTTLQKSKSMCQGSTYPVFTRADSFYPDLDPTQFSLLVNKVKVRAFNELKQIENAEAVAESRRQKIVSQVRRNRTEDVPALYQHARFGRKDNNIWPATGGFGKK